MNLYDEEYNDYVTLCRELKLQRSFQHHDWIYWPILGETRSSNDWELSNVHTRESETEVWIPAMDDWMELLEALGCRSFRFYDGSKVKGCQPGWYVSCVMHEGGKTTLFEGFASTRLEAIARLWMGVKEVENPDE